MSVFNQFITPEYFENISYFERQDYEHLQYVLAIEQTFLLHAFMIARHSNKATQKQAFEQLTPVDFYFKPHQIIFDHAQRAFLLGKEVDLFTISDQLKGENFGKCNGFFAQGFLDYLIDSRKNDSVLVSGYFDNVYRAFQILHLNTDIIKATKNGDTNALKQATETLQRIKNNEVFYMGCETLLKKELAMPNEIIKDFLYEGVTLLAGKPKLGKSWLMLDLAVSIASGGYFLGNKNLPIIEQGSVLYGALEDNERTLQIRFKTYLSNNRALVPDYLHFATQNTIKRVNEGGIAQLDQWCQKVESPRLIIIDTMKTLKPATKQVGYESDYDATQPYRELVDKYGVGILLVHHTRKAEANADPLDAISGSVGLSGSVDSLMVLTRARHENTARLFVTGRLMREQDMALDFKDGLWTYLGDGKLADSSAVQRKILEAIREGIDSPNIIAKDVSEPLSSVKRNLRQMLDDGIIKQTSYGKYQVN
jgi:hypothetical protein